MSKSNSSPMATPEFLVPRLVGATATAKAAKERATGTAWNELSMLATAEERCSAPEVGSARALLSHAAQAGTKLSWGKGITPGVSGWYSVNGTSRAVWTLNLGSGTGTSRAHVSLWFPEIQALLSDDQFATFVERLRNIQAFRTDIDSQAHKYPVAALERAHGQGPRHLHHDRRVPSLATSAIDRRSRRLTPSAAHAGSQAPNVHTESQSLSQRSRARTASWRLARS